MNTVKPPGWSWISLAECPVAKNSRSPLSLAWPDHLFVRIVMMLSALFESLSETRRFIK